MSLVLKITEFGAFIQTFMTKIHSVTIVSCFLLVTNTCKHYFYPFKLSIKRNACDSVALSKGFINEKQFLI